MKKILLFSLMVALCVGCFRTEQTSAQTAQQYSAIERQMQQMGLVDVRTVDTLLEAQLVYATPHNFMSRKLYDSINHAFLAPDVAQKLKTAHELLRKERLDLHLVVYDAARPISVQRDMWKVVEGTDMEDYVSNPAKGRGMHNYAAAVDVTLVDCTGHPLPMGSEYDFFGAEARVDLEQELLAKGRITQREYENRQLLRRVMTQAGFLTITSEWWHFNAVEPESVSEKYKVIE